MAKSPSDVYAEQVGAIIAGTKIAYQPKEPIELFIKNRRALTSLDGLSAQEKIELERMWRGQDLQKMLATGMVAGEEEGDDYPHALEVADIVTDKGELLYRMYGMNYGAMFLMRVDRIECVAFASQHSVELWRVEQRDLFWAMDRALRRGDHGFKQPVLFNPDDPRWDEIATKMPGTVASEPYVQKQFSDDG